MQKWDLLWLLQDLVRLMWRLAMKPPLCQTQQLQRIFQVFLGLVRPLTHSLMLLSFQILVNMV